MLKKWKIWKFANTNVTKPTDKNELEDHDLLKARAQRMILDGVKDHLIPHMAEKKIAKDMWDTLNQLFDAKNENNKKALRDKLCNDKMMNGIPLISCRDVFCHVCVLIKHHQNNFEKCGSWHASTPCKLFTVCVVFFLLLLFLASSIF